MTQKIILGITLFVFFAHSMEEMDIVDEYVHIPEGIIQNATEDELAVLTRIKKSYLFPLAQLKYIIELNAWRTYCSHHSDDSITLYVKKEYPLTENEYSIGVVNMNKQEHIAWYQAYRCRKCLKKISPESSGLQLNLSADEKRLIDMLFVLKSSHQSIKIIKEKTDTHTKQWTVQKSNTNQLDYYFFEWIKRQNKMITLFFDLLERFEHVSSTYGSYFSIQSNVDQRKNRDLYDNFFSLYYSAPSFTEAPFPNRKNREDTHEISLSESIIYRLETLKNDIRFHYSIDVSSFIGYCRHDKKFIEFLRSFKEDEIVIDLDEWKQWKISDLPEDRCSYEEPETIINSSIPEALSQKKIVSQEQKVANSDQNSSSTLTTLKKIKARMYYCIEHLKRVAYEYICWMYTLFNYFL